MRTRTSSIARRRSWSACLAAGLAVGLALGGCASDPDWARSGATPRPAAPYFPALRGSMRDATAELTHAPGPRAGVYRVYKGTSDRPTDELELREVSATDPDGSWTLRFSRLEERAINPVIVPLHELTLVPTPEGGVAMVRSVSFGERVITDFDPPLLLMPASMRPGDVAKHEGRMVVRPSREPERVKDEGKVVQEVEYVGEAELTLPGAPAQTAQVIRTRFTAFLGEADVRRQQEFWFAPTGELLALREAERVNVLSVPFRSSRELLVRSRDQDQQVAEVRELTD